MHILLPLLSTIGIIGIIFVAVPLLMLQQPSCDDERAVFEYELKESKKNMLYTIEEMGVQLQSLRREALRGVQEATSSPEGQSAMEEKIACSCVTFARKNSEFQPPMMGWIPILNLIPNKLTPIIGAWVLTSEGEYGHVAIITEMFDEEMHVIEKNKVACKITERRIRYDNPVIRGYWWN